MRGPVTVFVCGAKPRPSCACAHPGLYECEFPLRGKAAGKACARPLCATCAVTMPGSALHCGTHARLVNGEARR